MKKLTDDMWEELKKELFMNSREGLEDFLGFELPNDYDKDVVENQLDEIKYQMPDDIQIEFYKKYVTDKNMIKHFEDEHEEAVFKYIEDLYDENKKIVDEATGYFNNYVSINLSGIESKLIESAGRYCNRYASDILITRDSMLEYINKRLSNDYEYFVFAMRRNGSDGKAFLYERAKQYDTAYLSEFYRQIFICKVEHSDDDIHVTMKEIGGIQHIDAKEM